VFSPTSLRTRINDFEARTSDVYIAGFEGSVAKYWKNGMPTSLTNGESKASAKSIFVRGYAATDSYTTSKE